MKYGGTHHCGYCKKIVKNSEHNCKKNDKAENMKMFAWMPEGYGELSFFVMAKSKEDSIKYIEKLIKERGLRGSYVDGWGTEYYKLTECEEGQVIFNENE